MEDYSTPEGNNKPLGVYAANEKIYFYYLQKQGSEVRYRLDSSHEGTNFDLRQDTFAIFDRKKPIEMNNCSDFRITTIHHQHILTYKQQTKKQKNLCVALSSDLTHWVKKGKVARVKETGIIVPNFEYQGKYVMYFGEGSIHVATSYNFREWEVGPVVMHPHEDFYGTSLLKVAQAMLTDQGILLLYYQTSAKKGARRVTIRAALFDREDPTQLIKKYPEPVWESPREWIDTNIVTVGIVEKGGQLISYWLINDKSLIALYHPLYKQRIEKRPSLPTFLFSKLHHNPILGPIIDNFWESKATFNPAALYADDKVHLLYRAIGDDDVSVLGYAVSFDGYKIARRHPEPIYIPEEPFEVTGKFTKPAHVSPFASGGGVNGGCEDPRLTRIGDRIYMTYVAYNGWSPPRVALTSISAPDFFKEQWNWEKPVLISRPGEVNKNACILPEKVNGKYVIFHRVFPNILIDFVDSLEFDGATFLRGDFKISPRVNAWDSRKLGAGPPPLKTKDGWLLIYQAVDDRDDRKYKIGAMLLDLNNPTKVLHRTNKPILEPTHWYENVGHKAGVAYPCGAVTIGGELLMYYGGADTVVCVASAPMDDFISHLKTTETTAFERVEPLFLS